MEQNTTARQSLTNRMFVGLDLASKISTYHVLDASGETVCTGTVRTQRADLERTFAPVVPAVIAMETGSVSRVADEVLSSQGHTVVVGNPRRIAAIFSNVKKCDKVDAAMLAELVRVSPRLLSPIQHRTATAHGGLTLIRARDANVRARATQINLVRGMAKSYEFQLPSCDAENFTRVVRPLVDQTEFGQMLAPTLDVIAAQTVAIAQFDAKIKAYSDKHVPQAKQLAAIPGVGPLTAMAFALTVDDPHRFPNYRAVGAYLGLVPRRDQSGDVDKRLPITKCGDPLTRRLLVQCGQVILQERTKPTDLKRFGERLMGTVGSRRKRAVVAVARKLAVHMWTIMRSGKDYDPNHLKKKEQGRENHPALA